MDLYTAVYNEIENSDGLNAEEKAAVLAELPSLKKVELNVADLTIERIIQERGSDSQNHLASIAPWNSTEQGGKFWSTVASKVYPDEGWKDYGVSLTKGENDHVLRIY